MKVLIIGFAKIKYMPYLNLYLDNLDREKNEIHLIYWNRDLKDEDLSSVHGINLHEFKCYQEDEIAKSSKIKNFLKFRKKTKEILKDGFDFIIVLQTVPAVLLFDILTSEKFRERYIYDYRDCTYEKNKFYKYLVRKLTENSYATFISSKGFKKYLPDSDKIKCVHNILSEDIKVSESQSLGKKYSEKIRIGFWGFLREAEVNLEIIKKVSQDSRFELHYYGREQKTVHNLKKYVSENNIRNVFFHGEYNPKDRYEFLKNTDLIHNIYSNDNMRFAMSNKYYDGILFKTPQVCMQGSYMGELVEKKITGIALNPYNKGFTAELYNYYQSIDNNEFSKNCNTVFVEIEEDQNGVNNIIKAI